MNKQKSKTSAHPASKLGILAFLFGSCLLGLPLILNSDSANKIGLIEGVFYFVSVFLMISGLFFFIWLHRGKNHAKWTVLLKKVSDFLEGPLIAAIFILMLIISLEVGLRIYYQANPIRRLYWYTINVKTGDYSTLINNPVYQHADYATQAFFEESLNPQNHTITNDPVNGFIVPMNFNGTYINVINHIRLTTDQPKDYQSTIYLFGGSTIFNVAVPDEYTVASYLQREVNQVFGSQYRVVNLGVIGVTTKQQLIRLETLPLQAGDIVIWYDGFNDILESMDQDIGPLLNTLLKFEIFNQIIKPAFPQIMPPYKLSDPDTLQTEYLNNIENASKITTSQEAVFIHFLQPCLFMVDQPSPHESMLLATRTQHSPGWIEGFQIGYPSLGETSQILVASGELAFDLRMILGHDRRGYDQEIFLDDIHVNQIGNQIIAREIFEMLNNYTP